jgi:tRNA1(Val) A37 N6-methylase TrmN6
MTTEDDALAFTEDAVLGGRLRLRQPCKGHRFGHDAILLAAATPAHPGERAVELGAGVGAAGLALASRVERLSVTLVEIDPPLARLAAENASINKLGDRVNTVIADVARLDLAPGSADRVLMNPPFNDPARQNVSPDAARRLAHTAAGDTLTVWIEAAARLLRTGGTLTLIWRADELADVLSTLKIAFGEIAVLPVHPRPDAPAIRVLVRATKDSRAPVALYPALCLNDIDGKPSRAAEAVLRDAATLPLAKSSR